jgi:hypothetical protein
MLPCIILDLFLNNQPYSLIIPILFCYKTPNVLGILSAQQFHPDSAWKRSSETCMKLTSAECTVENSFDDGQRRCPKHVEFYNRIKWG